MLRYSLLKVNGASRKRNNETKTGNTTKHETRKVNEMTMKDNTNKQFDALRLAANGLADLLNSHCKDKAVDCDFYACCLEKLETRGTIAGSMKIDLLGAFRWLANAERAWDSWDVAYFGLNVANYKDGADDDALYERIWHIYHEDIKAITMTLENVQDVLQEILYN